MSAARIPAIWRRVVDVRRKGSNRWLALDCGHTKLIRGKNEPPKKTHCIRCEERTHAEG